MNKRVWMEFEERRKGRKLQRHERRVDDKFANSNLVMRKRMPQRPIRCAMINLPIQILQDTTTSNTLRWCTSVANSTDVTKKKSTRRWLKVDVRSSCQFNLRRTTQKKLSTLKESGITYAHSESLPFAAQSGNWIPIKQNPSNYKSAS